MPDATATEETSMPDPKTWGPIIEPGKDFTGTWMPLKESDAAVTTSGKNRKRNLAARAVLKGVPIYVIVPNQSGSGISAGLTSLLWGLSKKPVESKKGMPPVYTAKIRFLEVSDKVTDSSFKQETRHLKEVKKVAKEWHQFRIVKGKKSTRIITLDESTATKIKAKLLAKYEQNWIGTRNRGELVIGKKFDAEPMKDIIETICEIEITKTTNR